ncbi:hypothetical protein EVAR_9366_1 [Eumeta japonica]|uniref:Uncharacterized protein n=1 Tax=Eumeta variegata TaxID=151549 RepID=A0A4C1YQC9_EUMVA|nr:hypothetical protein EVAR_9366_1 [Eumeta japonica]
MRGRPPAVRPSAERALVRPAAVINGSGRRKSAERTPLIARSNNSNRPVDFDAGAAEGTWPAAAAHRRALRIRPARPLARPRAPDQWWPSADAVVPHWRQARSLIYDKRKARSIAKFLLINWS